MPVLLVIGVGPGIGLAVARRFAREGFAVGVIARSRATIDAALSALADSNVPTHGLTADAADAVSLASALDELVDRLGVPDVVVYKASSRDACNSFLVGGVGDGACTVWWDGSSDASRGQARDS